VTDGGQPVCAYVTLSYDSGGQPFMSLASVLTLLRAIAHVIDNDDDPAVIREVVRIEADALECRLIERIPPEGNDREH
jgi:hypothetical protein